MFSLLSLGAGPDLSWKNYPAVVQVQVRPTSGPSAYGAAFRREVAGGYSTVLSGVVLKLGDDGVGEYGGSTFPCPSWSGGAVGRGFVVYEPLNLEILPVAEDWGSGWETDRVLYDLGTGLFYGSATYCVLIFVRAIWFRLRMVWFSGWIR